MPYKPKIVTRTLTTATVTEDLIPKNSGLTNNELDSNFLNIRNASIGIASDDSTVIDIGLGNTLKVIGAGGVTTAVSGQSITIDGSGISGGGTNSFSTIAVAGQSDVVADSTTDTLTLAAGTGITLTTNTSTDTVTIASITPFVNNYNGSGITVLDSSEPLIIKHTGTAWGDTGGGIWLKTSNIYLAGTTSATDTTPGGDTGAPVEMRNSEGGDIALYSGTAEAAADNAGIIIRGPNTLGSNANQLELNASTSAKIVLKSNTIQIGRADGDASVTTNGAYDLVLNTNNGSASGSIQIHDGANGNIDISPNGTGSVVIDTISIKDNTISTNDTNADLQLKFNGTGTLDLAVPTQLTVGGTGEASKLPYDSANEIRPSGYLKIKINGTNYVIPYFAVS